MTRTLTAAFVLCAALALAGAAQPPQARKGRPAPRASSKRAAPPKRKPADAKTAAALPEVRKLDEAGLKSLLGAGARAGRPLLVNFWATWCAPCREEFPDLVEIRAQYAADRLDFVLVSLDDPSDIGKAVPEFLAEAQATAFPSYLLNADDSDAAINLVDPTWSGELPATFLYDCSGALVFKHKGRVKPAELRAALDEALKE